MISVKWVVDSFYLLLERLKGTKTVREVFVPTDLFAHLTGYSISGYEIRLYCQKKYYQRNYGRWFIPTQKYVTYRVFSVVSHSAPSLLREACELDIDIPAMVPTFISESLQKQFAVQAYLDILISRLQQGHRDVPQAA